MKNITLGAALAVSLISTLAISSPAMAQDGAATEQAGHYEWRNAPWTIGANNCAREPGCCCGDICHST